MNSAEAFVISRLDYCNALCYGIIDERTRYLQSVQNAAAWLVMGTRRWRSHLACAPPAAMASCAAARHVQNCDSHPPVFVRQRPGLPG